MPGDDDPNNPASRLFRELHEDLEEVARKVDAMATRLEEVAVLAERVETNRAEIRVLRKNLDAPGGLLDRVAKLENGGYRDGGEDGVTLSWQFLAAIVLAGGTVAAAVVAAIAKMVGG